MRNVAISVAALVAVTFVPAAATAQSRTVVGAGAGALAGAAVAGPVGAAVGGVTGAVVGSRTGHHRRIVRHHRRHRR